MNGDYGNPSRDDIRALLQRVKTIAVVGLSASPGRASHGIARALKSFGYRIIPVNPTVTEALGEKAYPSLREVPDPIDLVNVFRQSHHVAGIVDACIDLRLPALWLQDGVVDEVAARRAHEAGILVVMDRCIYRDYSYLMG